MALFVAVYHVVHRSCRYYLPAAFKLALEKRSRTEAVHFGDQRRIYLNAEQKTSSSR